MKLKILFYNKNIILNDLKLNSWIGILYTVILFFIMPISVFFDINYNNNLNYYSITKHLLKMQNPLLIMIYIVIPVITSVFIIRYIHKKSSSSVIHSMPFTRSEAFGSHIISGITLLSAPILFNSILMNIILLFSKSISSLNYLEIWNFAIISLLINISIFTFSMLVSTITGKSSAQVVLTYIFLLVPIGIYSFTMNLISKLLFGFNYNISAETIFMKMSPLTYFISEIVSEKNLHSLEMILVLLSQIVAFIVFGFLFYKNRKSEKAEELIAFDILKSIYKYGVTYCFSISLGMYFAFLFSKYEVNLAFYMGILFGGFIGYLVAEITLTKSLVGLKKYKGFLIYSIIIIALLLIVNLDLIGFEARIPEISSISTIEVSDNNIENTRYENIEGNNKKEKKTVILSYKNQFSDLEDFHRAAIVSKNEEKNSKTRYFSNIYYVKIKYNLLNGRTIVRKYDIKNLSVLNKYYPITETKEYKRLIHPVLTKPINDITEIVISSSFTVYDKENDHFGVRITEKDKIVEFIEALRKDINSETSVETRNPSNYWGEISLMEKEKNDRSISEKDLYLTRTTYNEKFRKTYKNVNIFLNQNGYLSEIVPSSDQIISVDVYKIPKKNGTNERKKIYEISSKEKIDKILDKSTFTWGLNDDYYEIEYNMTYEANRKISAQISVEEFNKINK
ncbi:DUF6449 domain-containing protein [Helicovermis profundi]|uniref:DUF6449 domain-containing protein n=1 Tax=Helicovermis profundi TaxID=3065157 RepID=A0AAU9E4A0_9FIRM|nr:hypothetical protein HLPR_17550 [Clostridia bacterium S502]